MLQIHVNNDIYNKYCLIYNSEGQIYIFSVVGSTCTISAECSLISHSECGTGSKCLCKTGYRGITGDENCIAGILRRGSIFLLIIFSFIIQVKWSKNQSR